MLCRWERDIHLGRMLAMQLDTAGHWQDCCAPVKGDTKKSPCLHAWSAQRLHKAKGRRPRFFLQFTLLCSVRPWQSARPLSDRSPLISLVPSLLGLRTNRKMHSGACCESGLKSNGILFTNNNGGHKMEWPYFTLPAPVPSRLWLGWRGGGASGGSIFQSGMPSGRHRPNSLRTIALYNQPLDGLGRARETSQPGASDANSWCVLGASRVTHFLPAFLG